jgi:hypothetical protein
MTRCHTKSLVWQQPSLDEHRELSKALITAAFANVAAQ